MGLQVKPDFIYAGVSRCGSTWIYKALDEHPDVFVPPAKDTEFFNSNFEKGMDWYYNFFSEGKDNAAVGEVSDDYYLFESSVNRIYEQLPDCKIIFCIREPVSRMTSNMYFIKRFKPDVQIEELLHVPEEYDYYNLLHSCSIDTVNYYSKLKPYFDVFPKEQILVLFFDELKADPDSFIRRIYDFIGVDGDFKPAILSQRSNAAKQARFAMLSNFAFLAARWMKKAGFANMVGKLKSNWLLRKVLFRGLESKSDLPLETQKKIYACVQDELEQLPALIGRDLPEEWTEYRGHV
ncbi:sulfotransferase domain-containing protein [Maridesulfovibrio sp.]|uniref:sulfotransferase domain-containing protein n=1 Tax=Maridesulfovibrio sp. TaxID=2795000 RepID=UPI0029CA612C|nr:sulfotransferase domain-containing protein [Maridesulfovibrio sp.]